MKIKVQIIGKISVKSAIESGITYTENNPLTFIAFSDTMKARVLEQFLKTPLKMGFSIFDGDEKAGEWHEPIMQNAIWNK